MPRKALTNSAGDFQLEPPVEPGNVPEGVIDELRILRTAANDASTDHTTEVLDTYAQVIPLTIFGSRDRRGYAGTVELLRKRAR